MPSFNISRVGSTHTIAALDFHSNSSQRITFFLRRANSSIFKLFDQGP